MIPHPVNRVHSLEIWLVFNRDWHLVLVFFGPHVHRYGPYTMIGSFFLHILILRVRIVPHRESKLPVTHPRGPRQSGFFMVTVVTLLIAELSV